MNIPLPETQQNVFRFVLPQPQTFANFRIADNTRSVRILRNSLPNTLTQSQQIHLWGESGCGSSHLLQAACHQVNESGLISAYISLANSAEALHDILENPSLFDCIALDELEVACSHVRLERMICDLFNATLDKHITLLLASHSHSARLKIHLKDLHTRINSCLQLHIHPLRGDDLAQFVKQLFTNKAMRVDDDIINYILQHYSRSCSSLRTYVALLEQESLRQHKYITKQFIRSCLGESES